MEAATVLGFVLRTGFERERERAGWDFGSLKSSREKMNTESVLFLGVK